MKYTQNTLDKLEELISEINYVVRYERGTFQSGYCILEQKKVVVLNKFLQLEGVLIPDGYYSETYRKPRRIK